MRSLIFRAWSHDHMERLKEMWWDGMSAEAIAIALGGLTGQQVKDKAQREHYVRNPELKVKRPNVPEPAPALRANGERVTIADVGPRECHWIEGEPSADVPVCGNATFNNQTVYCEHHYGRLYQ